MVDIMKFLSQFSINEIVLVILVFAACVKIVIELWDFFYNKVHNHFDHEVQGKANLNEISSKIDILSTSQNDMSKNINDQLDSISERVDAIQQETEKMKERMQDDTRSYIIDKYRRFVCEKKSIDSVSLEDIERHYMYYQAAQGDSYITNLMQKIRTLPIDVDNSSADSDKG